MAMANTLFGAPLFLKKRHYIQELSSLEDAFDMLDDWPENERDATFEVLEKACRMAAQGIFPLPAIRENLRRFLIKRHMLANIDEVPIVAKRSTDRNIGP
jgi:circadian clock protein KaiC